MIVKYDVYLDVLLVGSIYGTSSFVSSNTRTPRHPATPVIEAFASAFSLSRPSGESMTQYISRRKRCWKILKELDKELELSEGHRADMPLDLAGLDKNERIMIQASIGNARDFDKIADALVIQHPRIHIREAQSGQSKGTGKSRKLNK